MASAGFLSASCARHAHRPLVPLLPPSRSRPRPCSKPGERFVTRFQLTEEFEEGLCSSDPWLVLHKIDSPTKMRYVGARVANCSDPEPWLLPESIEEYIPEATRTHWAEQRKEHLNAAGLPADPPRVPRPPPPKQQGGGGSSSSSSSTAAAKTSAVQASGVQLTAGRADVAAALQAVAAAGNGSGKLGSSLGSTAHLGRLGAAGAAQQADAAAAQAGGAQADSAATQAEATAAAAAALAGGSAAGASGGGATLAGGAVTDGAADPATLGVGAVQK